MKPVVVLSSAQNQCVSFSWDEFPQWHVGYRFVENEPMTSPAAQEGKELFAVRFPSRPEEACAVVRPAWAAKGWSTAYEEKDATARVALTFRSHADGSAWCRVRALGAPEEREWFFEPAEDGVWMWMRVTARHRIPGAYLLQQCLRFTGALNEGWRHGIARVPFLSEFDLLAMGNPNTSLTFVRSERAWVAMPVEHAVRATGIGSWAAPAGAQVVDSGLIVREALSPEVRLPGYWERVAAGMPWKSVVAGLYWQRTALVSNRHPADCLHAMPDVGPLEAGESRVLRGKCYLMEGTREDLLRVWRRDFTVSGYEPLGAHAVRLTVGAATG